MKQTIRYNVFETNSSSEHSLVISMNEGYFSEEEIEQSFDPYLDFDKDKNRIIRFEPNDLVFERYPFDVLTSYVDKLKYLIASFASIGWVDSDFEELWEELHARHNWLAPFKYPVNNYYNESDKSDTINDYGYVDHQSFYLIEDVFIAYDLNLKSFDDIDEFLKNKKYVIIIDGDEYRVFGSYVDSHLAGKDKFENIYEFSKTQKPSKLQDNDTKKMLEYPYHYSYYLDQTSILLMDCNENYAKAKLNEKYLCDFSNEIDSDENIKITNYNLYNDDCILTYPVEKFRWLSQIYACDSVKFNKLLNIIQNRTKAKSVSVDVSVYGEASIKISDYKLIEKFLELFKIDEEEFIFNAQYRVVTNGYIFQQLLAAKALDTSKIIDVYNLSGVMEAENE